MKYSDFRFRGNGFEQELYENVEFERCTFETATFGNRRFRSCRFIDCDFSGANVGRARFDRERDGDATLFLRCTFSRIVSQGAVFNRCEFNECRFRGELNATWQQVLVHAGAFEGFHLLGEHHRLQIDGRSFGGLQISDPMDPVIAIGAVKYFKLTLAQSTNADITIQSGSEPPEAIALSHVHAAIIGLTARTLLSCESNSVVNARSAENVKLAIVKSEVMLDASEVAVHVESMAGGMIHALSASLLELDSMAQEVRLKVGCRLMDLRLASDVKGATVNVSCENENLEEGPANQPRCDLQLKGIAVLTIQDLAIGAIGIEKQNAVRLLVSRCHLVGTDISGMKLPDSQFYHSVLDRIQGQGADLSNSILEFCSAREADFSGANISNGHWKQTSVEGATLSSADLSTAKFERCQMRSADLRGITVNADTLLTNCDLGSAKMFRYTQFQLKDFGGMTVGQRMALDTSDDYVRLRMLFHGWYRYLALMGLISFVGPYALFAIVHYWHSRFLGEGGGATIPMIRALWNLVRSDNNWTAGIPVNWISLGAFWIGAIYNVLRLILLAKTLRMEAREEATGLPVVFAMGRGWSALYSVVKWGILLYLIAGAVQVLQFLSIPIPIG